MRTRTLLIALVAALSVGTQANAQQHNPAVNARPAVQEPDPGPRLDIDFPGGTVADYLKAVQKAATEAGSDGANVVPFTDLSKRSMPPVRLKSVEFATAMNLLANVAWKDENAHNWRLRPDWMGDAVAVNAEQLSFGRMEGDSSAVWSIERFQPLVPAEDVLSAIEAALSTIGGDPTVRYHPETGLVIVRGAGEHLNAVAIVLDGLEGTVDSRRYALEMRGQVEMALLDVGKAETRWRLRQREAEVAQRRLDELKQMVDKGLAPANEYLDHELAFHRAQAEVSEGEADVRRAQIKLENLTRQAPKSND